MLTPVLILSGSVGTGKSTLAAEINDAPAELRIPNAVLGLDVLVWQWPATSE
jgi:adenylate kinase family enzyme